MQTGAIHKSKQFFFHALHYLTPVFALTYIIVQLYDSYTKHGNSLIAFADSAMHQVIWIAGLLLGFTTLNWVLEGCKWKICIQSFQEVQYAEALRQCLSGAAISIFTPAKTGDYIIKAYYYNSSDRIKVIQLNTLSNVTQMAMTSIFGLGALLVLLQTFPEIASLISVKSILLGALLVLGLLSLGYWIYSKWSHYLILKFKKSLDFITLTLIWKLVGLSLLRYLVFSFQFVFLMVLLGSELDLYLNFVIVSSIYLINSMVPTSAMADIAIKGSLGVFLFGLFGVNAWIVIVVNLLMWVSNHVVPALAGSLVLWKTSALRLNKV